MTMPTGDAQTSPPTHDGSTPPLPRAAPAPAAEAGTTEAGWMQLVNDMLTRAEAAEAERDRLSAELAAAKDAKDRFDAARNAALTRAERAEAEVAALRGAMPDPQMLDMYAEGIEWEGYEASGLRKAAAAIRALATATPTPPAAEAGTGGGGPVWPEPGAPAPAEKPPLGPRRVMPPVWTWEAPDGWTLWGERWLVIHGNMTPSKCDVFPRDGVPRVLWGSGEYGIEVVKLWGPRVEAPDGWEAALDTPQEADHAR